MRCSTGLILAAMAIGDAMAGPTHAHLHRRAHEKKDINYATLDVDWASAYSVGMAEKSASAAAAAKATTAPVVAAAAVTTTAAQKASSTAKASTAASSSSSTSGNLETDIQSLFAGLVGAANSITSFGTAVAPKGTPGDNYFGNYGSPYGHNMMLVSSAEGQAFTNTFKNTQSSSITVNVWNKVGSDLQVLSGSALAPTDTSLTFVLKPNESKTVAFQDNSQVAWAQACSGKTGSGAYQTTWGEANFVSTGSGYDVTAINNANNDYAMTITSSEAQQCTSSRTENFWLTATEPIGSSDGSCFIAQSTATLQTIMGGTV